MRNYVKSLGDSDPNSGRSCLVCAETTRNWEKDLNEILAEEKVEIRGGRLITKADVELAIRIGWDHSSGSL